MFRLPELRYIYRVIYTDMTEAIFIMVGIYAGIFLINPLITILHELGHAFAYLILTKPDHIDVFIGSYGNTTGKMQFTIGKLRFYFKFSFPYISNGGMCRADKAEYNYVNKIIILFAGPVFTFFIALVVALIAFNSNVHEQVKLFCFIFILCSFASLVGNLRSHTVAKADLDSDGKQIRFVYRAREVYGNYLDAYASFNKGDFGVSVDDMLKVYAAVPNDARVLRYLSMSFLQLKDLDNAEKYLYEMKNYNMLTTVDYLNRGYMFSMTERHDLAIADYRKALKQAPDHLYGLNNLGYELILKGEYIESKKLLEKAIELDPKFAYPYSSLGYLKLITGDLDEGKRLTEKSMKLLSENAYVYKNLGVYYLKTGEKELAIANLNKAFELDNLVNVESYLKEAELLEMV